MSVWDHVASPMNPQRLPTPLERQAVAEVCEMATELARLELIQRPAYLAAIRDTTSPRQRSIAVAFTDLDSPAWRPLMAMLDALIATEPGYVTEHGWFDDQTIRDHGGRLASDPNGTIIQFPDLSGNYRAPGDRNPVLGRFRASTVVPIRREVEWWMQPPVDMP